MKLISKFSDYYDSFVAYGFDPQVVYVRKNEKIDLRYYQSREEHRALFERAEAILKRFSVSQGLMRKMRADVFNSDGDGDLRVGYVGFCGEIYPFLCVNQIKKKLNGSEPGFEMRFTGIMNGPEFVKRHFFFSVEDLVKYLADRNTPMKNLRELKLGEFFVKKSGDDDFFALNCPIFAYVDNHFEVNPKLIDYSFPRIKDGMQAFQEISAYISGSLNAKDQMKALEITDVDRALSKGFDNMSFRRHASKRV